MSEKGTSDGGAGASGIGRGGRQTSGLRCEFCGAVVPRVQRVALDRDYERLQTPHRIRYACPTCSEAKERRRLGLSRG